MAKKPKKSKANGAAPPEPEARPEQEWTHAAVPKAVLAAMSRLLTRLAMDGQDAAELLGALQQCRLLDVGPDQPEASGEGPPEGPPNQRVTEGGKVLGPVGKRR